MHSFLLKYIKVQKDFKLSRDLFKDILDGSSNPNFYGLYILCQCYVTLNDLPNAESSLKLAMASLNEKVKEESTRNRLKSELEIKLANIFFRRYRAAINKQVGKRVAQLSISRGKKYKSAEEQNKISRGKKFKSVERRNKN